MSTNLLCKARQSSQSVSSNTSVFTNRPRQHKPDRQKAQIILLAQYKIITHRPMTDLPRQLISHHPIRPSVCSKKERKVVKG